MAALIQFPSILFSLCLIFSCYSYVNCERYTEFEKEYSRKLSKLELDPDCGMDWCKNSSFTGGVVSHVVATGPEDELHHLFCTVGAPSLMISRTPIGAKLSIDYTKFLNPEGAEAINYTPSPEHSFGMIFPNLYEYDDSRDLADLSAYRSNSSANIRHELTDLHWITVNHTGDSTYQQLVVNATASTSNRTLFNEGGYLSFIIRYDSKDGRLDSRPHMEFTANSTMVTVVMEDLVTNFAHSRFAVEMVMFSTENKSITPAQTWNATQVTLTKSLDDEYSPGVFEMRNWHANLNMPREKAWGYAQWKPVVYNKQSRLNADLSDAKSYPNLNEDRAYIVNYTLRYRSLFDLYFGDSDTFEVSLNATNVSFGITKDKFFEHTKYLVWTMSVGMGPAPEDDVSTLVILVIAIGLGIPLVLMIVSSVYVCVKAVKKRRLQTYTRIDD